MTYLARVTRNTLALFGNRVILTVANFSVGILVVRHLGAERFGAYTMVFAFLSFFSAFAGNSGVDHILVREVSRGLDDDSQRRKIASAVALRLGLGGFGALLAITGAFLLYGNRQETAYIAASTISLLLSFHETNSPLIVHYNARLELFVPQVIGTPIFLAFAAIKLMFARWRTASASIRPITCANCTAA